MNIKASPYSNTVAVLANLALAYAVYMVTRVAFVLENWNLFAAGWGELRLSALLAGSLRFDSSALFYTNALWIVLMLLPLHWKERPWWHTMCKWIYMVVNTFSLTVNLVDAVYSQYTGRRTTATFFSEFSNEGNLGSIVATELVGHWYLLLLGVGLVAAMWWLYVKPRPGTVGRSAYYVTNSLALLVAVPMAVFAMRGGFTRMTRPITLSNANQYVRSPQQASIVLNTPFSIIRTIGKKPFANPRYFAEGEVDSLYTPLHRPQGDGVVRRKNVVVLIMESFSREYIGYYHRQSHPDWTGYTPFLDSLLEHSVTWEYTFANGRKSIDGMPSVLSSIPMFVEPFFLTPSALNDVGGLARLLGAEGYGTAFFHGAANGSMGFQAFASATGFSRYYGRSEYNADPRFGGEADFDGMWAVWDEPFLQFYAAAMSQMEEPFMTALFSASSHHPFRVPDRYRESLPDGPLAIHKPIAYSDNALRKFFDAARRQPWFKNTLFVLTADHTNMLQHDESRTSLGVFSVPILIYDPSGELEAGRRPGVAQQIDIMPTVLHLLGYGKPYIAFGKDLLATDTAWAVNYSNGIYQYVEGDYVLLFDGQQPTALYRYAGDPLMKQDLLEAEPALAARMERRLKAIVQSYMERMTANRLVLREEDLQDTP
ncbi:MAG: sulfatase-like hydrolase/transferase [Bacteroidales bacterium]|nr:sulfatase-like hydrolase/transferase [Bacteroidales bacterium]